MNFRVVNSWRISLSAAAGGYDDLDNLLGFDDDATDGLDEDWDVPKPPPPPVNYLQVGFVNNSWSDVVNYFSEDIRYYRGLYMDDIEVWACSLSTDLSSSYATLSFAQSDNFPDSYSYWVLDGTDSTDVTLTQTYDIDITDGQATFHVMVKGYVPPAPDITILDPINGQIVNVGDELEIDWEAQNEVLSYMLSYSVDGGENWTDIAYLDNPELNTYTWSVPGIYSTDVFIRVTGTGLGGVEGTETVGPLAIITGSSNYQLSEGWNLISLPLDPMDGSTFLDVFTDALPTPNYIYNLLESGQYAIVSDSTPVNTASGYWMALFENASVTLEAENQIISIKMNTTTYLPSWRDGDYTKSVSANKKFGGGVINELSHELDLMLFLFGKPKALFAKYLNSNSLKVDVEDIVDIIFKFNKRLNLSMHLDFCCPYEKREIEILFKDHSKITLDLRNNSLRIQSLKKTVTKNFFLEKNYYTNNQIKKMISISKSKKDTEWMSELLDSIYVLHIIKKIKESNISEKMVELKKNV